MRSVTRTSVAAAAVALVAGTLTVAPATAASDPVTDLIGDLLGQPSGGHHRRWDDRSDYGHTSAPDGRLRHGCHNYRYRYVVTTPTRDWTVETFLDDRTGETVGSGAFMAGSDPSRGRSHFRLCFYATHPGRFKIRAKVHWYSRDDTDHKVWLRPSYFRLRHP